MMIHGPSMTRMCLLGIIGLLVGCSMAQTPSSTPTGQLPPQVAATATAELAITVEPTGVTDADQPPAETAVPDESPLATPLPIATETVPDAAALLPGGPWWAFAGPGGLWVTNADGTGLTHLTGHNFGRQPDITSWAAPSGGRLAYVTAQNEHFKATLTIVTLPGLQVEAAISLTSAATEPAQDAVPGDAALDAVTVARQGDSLAWSPDGRWLAFVGMRDGPTADLYLYDTESGIIERLTDGPTQAAQLSWSPDGRAILHAGLEGKNIDTGFRVGSWWAAVPTGGEATLFSAADPFAAGWSDPRGVILYNYDFLCGKHGLQRVTLPQAARQLLWENYFDHVAVDPDSGAVLVAVRAELAGSPVCNHDGKSGIFLTHADSRLPLPVVEDDVSEVIWSPAARLFLARTDNGILAVSPTGQFIDLDVPAGAAGFPVVATNTRALAWRGDGLWVSELTSSLDQPPRRIFTAPVGPLMWSPDGSRLLFVSEGMLYALEAPSYTAVAVTAIELATTAVWVRP